MMTDNTDTLWEIEPHTQAKHEILQRYLGAWFPILGSRIPRIVYIDGFCGPGRYIGGEDGSPVIAVREAMRQPLLANSRVTFLFIDERPDRISHLESILASIRKPNNFNIECKVNEFENTLTEILDNLARDGHQLAPTFAFIDPFGFKGAPFRLVQRLLSNERTEVFITIMIRDINRFVNHPDPAERHHIKSLLGATDEEIDSVINSRDRVLAFRQLYQSKLRMCAKFVRFFEMRDKQNNVLYDLFFASNHPLGHTKMKEVFWKVDCQSGFKFSDRTDPNQPVLFELDPSVGLSRELVKKYQGTTLATGKIFEYVENDTAFITSHAKKALLQLENNNEITIDPIKSDGSKRRKGSFPEGVIIHF